MGAAYSVLVLTLLGSQTGKPIPANLQNFMQQITANGACNDPFPGSFYDREDGDKSWRYCKGDGFIYLKGPDSTLANMDVDCDGVSNALCPVVPGSDTQSQTSFRDELRKSYGIEDLDASVHSYAVFGNADDNHVDGYTTFNPQEHGIRPLSLMAVVCGGRLFYGIWGDQNGSDGPPLVGEASISLARLCFGKDMTNTNGHDPADVLYIAFEGDSAVPGPSGAAWTAKSSGEFQSHKGFNALGDRLVAGIR